MAIAEALDVGFVEDGIVPGDRRRGVVFPVETVVGDDGLEHDGGVVAPVERQVTALRADLVAEVRVVPAKTRVQGACVRVEQQLVGIEALTLFGQVRPMYAVAIDLSGADAGHEAVPDAIGPFRQGDAFQLAQTARVEQAEFNLVGVLGKQGEIDALRGGVPMRAQRGRVPRPEVGRFAVHARSPFQASWCGTKSAAPSVQRRGDDSEDNPSLDAFRIDNTRRRACRRLAALGPQGEAGYATSRISSCAMSSATVSPTPSSSPAERFRQSTCNVTPWPLTV